MKLRGNKYVVPAAATLSIAAALIYGLTNKSEKEDAETSTVLAEWLHRHGTEVNLGSLAGKCVKVNLPGYRLDEAEVRALGPEGDPAGVIDLELTGFADPQARAQTNPFGTDVARLAIGGESVVPKKNPATICGEGEREGFTLVLEEGSKRWRVLGVPEQPA